MLSKSEPNRLLNQFPFRGINFFTAGFLNGDCLFLGEENFSIYPTSKKISKYSYSNLYLFSASILFCTCNF